MRHETHYPRIRSRHARTLPEKHFFTKKKERAGGKGLKKKGTAFKGERRALPKRKKAKSRQCSSRKKKKTDQKARVLEVIP